MFLFNFDCRLDANGPLADDPEFDDVGGAYVGVWISFPDFDGAKVLGRFYAESAGWVIVSADDEGEVERDDLDNDSKQLYDEASEYGYTTASYMWPKDVPDANGKFEKEGP